MMLGRVVLTGLHELATARLSLASVALALVHVFWCATWVCSVDEAVVENNPPDRVWTRAGLGAGAVAACALCISSAHYIRGRLVRVCVATCVACSWHAIDIDSGCVARQCTMGYSVCGGWACALQEQCLLLAAALQRCVYMPPQIKLRNECKELLLASAATSLCGPVS